MATAHPYKVLLLLVALLASQGMPAVSAADIRRTGIEDAAAATAAAPAAPAACFAPPFEGEATEGVNCFEQQLPEAGGYPNGTVCRGKCAGAARKVTAACNDGSWVMQDGPCSAAPSGCYALPWIGYKGVVVNSSRVTSGGKLTLYGPHAKSTVLSAACEKVSPARNMSVTCQDGQWTSDSFCWGPQYSCYGKPFKPERMNSSSCSNSTYTAAGSTVTYHLAGTVCTGLCLNAARSLTSACVDGAWKMLDGICQLAPAACYSSPFADDPAAERGNITITSGGKLIQQGPWARGTVATSVCEGVSPARAVASRCRRGRWTVNATCSGACMALPKPEEALLIACDQPAPYPNGTRCSASCTGVAPAKNITASCNSSKWEFDMPCRAQPTSTCSDLPGPYIGWLTCSKPSKRQSSSSKHEFKDGTTCSGVCLGTSAGNMTASCVGGAWRMDGACSAATAPGLACANPPAADIITSSWRNCSTGVSPSGSYCIGSCTSGVGALVAVCGNGTHTLTGSCGSGGVPVTCPSQLLTDKPGFAWQDFCTTGSRTAGQVCRGSCKDGYQAAGDVYAVCNGNGVFDIIGDCIGTKCRNPPDSASGSISWPGCSAFNSTTDSGERCTGSCSNGFLGGVVAECRNGVFTTIGSCSGPVTCPNPPTTTPGVLWSCSGASGSVGQVCSGTCATGYTQAGSISATCGRLGAYQVTGSCSPNPCTNPPNNDATLNWGACATAGTTTSSSTSCVGSCVSGYIGSKVARCELGFWSIVGNTCTGPVTCRNPPLNQQGYQWSSNCLTGTVSPGTTCTATCSSGFPLLGAAISARCDEAGVYQITGGTCFGNSCVPPPNRVAGYNWAACNAVAYGSGSSCSGSCTNPFTGSSISASCSGGQWSVLGSCTSRAPTVKAVAASTDEDTPVDIDLAASVSDPDPGDSLVLSIQTLPINGALTQRLTQTGTMWQYTPNSDFAGTDTFVYKATDRSGASNTATVTVTVRQVNDPPTARDMTISVREGEPLDINLLASVSDPDAGDTLTISITRHPTNGQLTQLASPVGTWRYTPPASFTGAESFDFKVTDGALTFATATATLDIKANGAPIIANQAVVTTNQGLPLLIDLLAGASDPEKDPISVSITSGPTLGSLVQQASGKWLYTPFNDGTGRDSFDYYVADDRGARSATVTADVTIEAFTTASYSSFCATTGLTSQGDGYIANCEMVMAAGYGKRASFFRTQTIDVSSGFRASFGFKITNAGAGCGGDGIVFILQATGPTALGWGGGGLGYMTRSFGDPFIQNKVVGVEIDTVQNSEFGDSPAPAVQVTVSFNEQRRCAIANPIGPSPNYVWVDYAAEVLSIYYSTTTVKPGSPCTTLPLDLTAYFGTSALYVGFSSSTGACYNNHFITGFQMLF